MAKKFISIIIVPNWKTSFRTINVPQKAVRILLAAGLTFLVLFVFFLLDYFSMTETKARYRELLKENAAQKETIATYESRKPSAILKNTLAKLTS